MLFSAAVPLVRTHALSLVTVRTKENQKRLNSSLLTSLTSSSLSLRSKKKRNLSQKRLNLSLWRNPSLLNLSQLSPSPLRLKKPSPLHQNRLSQKLRSMIPLSMKWHQETVLKTSS